MKKFTETFKSFDAFGKRINLTINNRNTYGTCFGTVLTLLIYMVVLIYAQERGQKLYKRLDTFHQTTIMQNDID